MNSWPAYKHPFDLLATTGRRIIGLAVEMRKAMLQDLLTPAAASTRGVGREKGF